MSATIAIIPSFNGLARLRQNLPALLAQSLPFARVLVIDDGSDDGSVEALRARGDVEVLSLGRNRGFAAAANAGIARALEDPATDAIALVNNDVELDRDWHGAAVAVLFADPRRGACATCLLRADAPERVDSAGIEWRAPGWADNFLAGAPAPADPAPRAVLGASAGAALYRRELFEDVGLFDESLVMYQEDVDLALRARRAGWSAALAPAARGRHAGGSSNRPFPLGGSWADYWNARNRLPVLVAALDGADWQRSWWPIVAAQARHLLASVRERRAPAVLAGTARALTRLPGALRKRRQDPRSSARQASSARRRWTAGRV